MQLTHLHKLPHPCRNMPGAGRNSLETEIALGAGRLDGRARGMGPYGSERIRDPIHGFIYLTPELPRKWQ
jgi:hypothetical protein